MWQTLSCFLRLRSDWLWHVARALIGYVATQHTSRILIGPVACNAATTDWWRLCKNTCKLITALYAGLVRETLTVWF